MIRVPCLPRRTKYEEGVDILDQLRAMRGAEDGALIAGFELDPLAARSLDSRMMTVAATERAIGDLVSKSSDAELTDAHRRAVSETVDGDEVTLLLAEIRRRDVKD